MKIYQEITLLPSEEIGPYFLWEKIYLQVHLAIVDNHKQHPKTIIGVSFPEYSLKTLGSKLRIFSHSEQDLQRLNLTEYLSNFIDYCHVTSFREVPKKTTKAVIFKRFQQKQKSESQAKRKAKRQKISLTEAYEQLNKKSYKNYPFITLKSLSSKEKYKLMILKENSKYEKACKFNSYGLNLLVPDF